MGWRQRGLSPAQPWVKLPTGPEAARHTQSPGGRHASPQAGRAAALASERAPEAGRGQMGEAGTQDEWALPLRHLEGSSSGQAEPTPPAGPRRQRSAPMPGVRGAPWPGSGQQPVWEDTHAAAVKAPAPPEAGLLPRAAAPRPGAGLSGSPAFTSPPCAEVQGPAPDRAKPASTSTAPPGEPPGTPRGWAGPCNVSGAIKKLGDHHHAGPAT